MIDKCFVIQFNNELYWTGYGSDPQIRNARFYHRLKECREWGTVALRKISKTSNATGFKILEVEINVVGEVKDG